MSSEPSDLVRLRAAGTPREVGLALGRAGRDAVHRHLLACDYWRMVTGPAHAARAARLAGATRQRFPRIWAEIEGLAEGLGLPLAEVAAWNFRGDLIAAVPDGCTTVMLPGAEPVIAHNEDGLPFFRGAAMIAEVAAEGEPGLTGFCYPGSIPGHTFAVTRAGLVQTVNNIRLTGLEPAIPRMALGRAMLGAPTPEAAVAVLRAGAASGGFHMALCHRDDRRILSVEFGGGEVSVREVTAPALHANHALHLVRGLAAQTVTRSSGDRQARGEALLALGAAPLVILRDTGGPGLPIRRDAADDPDHENTLATAVFRISDTGIHWSIHDRPTGDPALAGTA